ncbi:MAG: hypothetical protein ACRC28_02690 [Clostridium sp.]|uniref:hypothetical protein n=1 Tax=Clostridium sp. TaxID=1506 RepID=UPI003F2E1169
MNSYEKFMLQDAKAYIKLYTTHEAEGEISRITAQLGYEMIEKFLKNEVCNFYEVDIKTKTSFNHLGMLKAMGLNSLLKSHDIVKLFKLINKNLNEDYAKYFNFIIPAIKDIYNTNRYPSNIDIIELQEHHYLAMLTIATKIINKAKTIES